MNIRKLSLKINFNKKVFSSNEKIVCEAILLCKTNSVKIWREFYPDSILVNNLYPNLLFKINDITTSKKYSNTKYTLPSISDHVSEYWSFSESAYTNLKKGETIQEYIDLKTIVKFKKGLKYSVKAIYEVTDLSNQIDLHGSRCPKDAWHGEIKSNTEEIEIK